MLIININIYIYKYERERGSSSMVQYTIEADNSPILVYTILCGVILLINKEFTSKCIIARTVIGIIK